jgi:hypothetical protein
MTMISPRLRAREDKPQKCALLFDLNSGFLIGGACEAGDGMGWGMDG